VLLEQTTQYHIAWRVLRRATKHATRWRHKALGECRNAAAGEASHDHRPFELDKRTAMMCVLTNVDIRARLDWVETLVAASP
jgi:hypothetical protein